jgi:hypothetical protein
MKNMKRIDLLIICIAFLAFAFTSCIKKDDNILAEQTKEPIETVENFFKAFENIDYEAMKIFCTKECIDTYFHEEDVFGMACAKVNKFGETKINQQMSECAVFVDVDMETTKASALYPGTETSFYVVLKKQSDASWLIDAFVTLY